MTAGGSTLVEALVALVLTALAAGALAAVALVSGRGLAAARADATGTALAAARLEVLRVAPRTSGADDAQHDGITYARRWSVAGGRGRTTALEVGVAWPGREIRLASEVAP